MQWEEAKQIIISNQMNYKDFAKKFNISIDDAIRIFQHLDLKKCSAGENCANFDGPVQSRSNFANSKNSRDKLANQCIYCKKQYYQDNKKYRNQKSRQYYHNNKEYCKQLNQQHHQDNKEYYKQKARRYHQNNKEYCKQKDRRYQQNNKEYCKQYRYQHYQNNKEHYKQYRYQYRQNNKEYCKEKIKEYYNSYAKFNISNDRISYAEKTRQDPNNSELLQVKCTYCNQWFNPINRQVWTRINALERETSLGTENRFYCSEECKQACPIYRQRNYSKDDPKYLDALGSSREVQTELRQLVFEHDNWTCQRCDTHKDDLPSGVSLHCHHIEGVRHEPIESADTDMCMTVCSECHKEIHKIPGCTYQDMQCKAE